jgi:hypothetical protein
MVEATLLDCFTMLNSCNVDPFNDTMLEPFNDDYCNYAMLAILEPFNDTMLEPFDYDYYNYATLEPINYDDYCNYAMFEPFNDDYCKYAMLDPFNDTMLDPCNYTMLSSFNDTMFSPFNDMHYMNDLEANEYVKLFPLQQVGIPKSIINFSLFSPKSPPVTIRLSQQIKTVDLGADFTNPKFVA